MTMITGLHHVSLKCELPEDIVIRSTPELYARVAFCYGPLGEEIEFFQQLDK